MNTLVHFVLRQSCCRLLRSEIPSGMCAKLRTVTASNNRDHAPQSFLLLHARATHTYFCSSRTSRSNHTFNATPPERLQQGYSQESILGWLTYPLGLIKRS